MNKKETNELYKRVDKELRLNENRRSYFTKQEIIEFLNKTDFKYVKKAYLELITGLLYDSEKDIIKECYKTVDLS